MTRTTSPHFPSPDIWLPHRVSYGETDKMGYVYYAEYLHFFERGRSEYIREIMGCSYADIEARGLMLPVREASCRYRQPARYDDLIQIRVGLSEIGRASLTFVYAVMDEERKYLLAQGMTQHPCVNLEGKPLRMPDWFAELLRKCRA